MYFTFLWRTRGPAAPDPPDCGAPGRIIMFISNIITIIVTIIMTINCLSVINMIITNSYYYQYD